jgi:hypothetical protein
MPYSRTMSYNLDVDQDRGTPLGMNRFRGSVATPSGDRGVCPPMPLLIQLQKIKRDCICYPRLPQDQDPPVRSDSQQ